MLTNNGDISEPTHPGRQFSCSDQCSLAYLFQSIQETIACDELVLDTEGKAVDWIVREINAAYETTFGLRREDIVGRKATTIFGEDMVNSFLPAFSQVVREKKPVRFDFHLREKELYFVVSAFPMGGLHFGTIGLDVSEHRRAEKERDRLLAELDATINAIAEAVVIYGRNGEILRMNPVANEFLQYSDDQMSKPLGERVAGLQLYDPGGAPFPLREILRKVMEGEIFRGVPLVFDSADGHRRWISASAAPIHTADGRLIGAVGTAADVSRVRDLQAEREVYLQTISHDLRTPLTVIAGHAQLLQARLDQGDPETKESVETILKESEGMANMIDALVDTAFLESGQMQLSKEPIELVAFVKDYLRRAEMALERDRVDVAVPFGLPPVHADPYRLERILTNLISNALKYSFAGSRVRLEACREDHEIRVSVHDEGPGIDKEDLPHIFDRFYRTKGGRKSKGIGLGLYICRMLTEAHGGRIWVTSEPEKVTAFSFTLPIDDSPLGKEVLTCLKS